MRNLISRTGAKVSGAVAVAATAALISPILTASPAAASLDPGGIKYLSEKSLTCPAGKYGYFFVEGNHVSYKKIYFKNRQEVHWSSTAWTPGFNGDATLVRVLGKNSSSRTTRAYLAVAGDKKLGISPMSQLSYFLYCDSRDLIGNNSGDALTRLSQVWRSTYWKLSR